MVWFFILVLISLESLCADEISELLNANASAIQLIRDLQVYTENDVEFWAWSRGEEKARHTIRRMGTNGEFVGSTDELFSGSGEYRVLSGWDIRNPPDLKPWDQKGVSGQISLNDPYPVREIQSFPLAEQFLLAFHWQDRMGASSESQLLRDFVKRALKTELMGEVEKNGRKVKQLRVYFPGVNELPPDGSYYDFYIDPASNFMITAYLGHYESPEVYLGGDGPEGKARVERMKDHPFPLPIETWSEALEMKDFGGGVFLPTQIRAGGNNTQNGRLVFGDGIYSSIKRLEVNTPIPAEIFELKFPDNLIVQHTATGSQTGTVQTHGELWGPNNLAKMKRIEAQDILNLRSTSERGYWVYLWWVVGAVGLVGILFLARYLRRAA